MSIANVRLALVCSVVMVILSGCDIGSVNQGPVPIIYPPIQDDNPVDIVGTPLDTSGDAIDRGRQLFQSALCSQCHNDTGSAQIGGLFPFSVNDFVFTRNKAYTDDTESTLGLYIANEMPSGSATRCEDSCAEDIAAYLWSFRQSPLDFDDPGSSITVTPLSMETYLRKAKNLLVGLPVTDEDLVTVAENEDGFRTLLTSWVDHPNFLEKITWFLDTTLQSSEPIGRLNIASQILGEEAAARLTHQDGRMYQNLSEYTRKTFKDIVAEDRPFTEIVTTQEWYMTSAMMSFLIASDGPLSGELLQIATDDCGALDVNAQSTIAQMIEAKQWCIPQKVGPSGSAVATKYKTRRTGYFFAYLIKASNNGLDSARKVLQNSDYSDWRKVNIQVVNDANKNQAIPFYDLPSLRKSDTIYLRVARPGFQNTLNFFTKWRTNIDNQFRVVMNQTLIVGLGRAFSELDESIPLSDDGLDEAHASQPDCNACHQLLDPMRDFFMNVYDPDTSRPLDASLQLRPTFSFSGYSPATDTSTIDLADAIASHPLFAEAWVKKLCFYANSTDCSDLTTEVAAVAENFELSGFRFKSLVVDFFDSPLFKNQYESLDATKVNSVASISRKQHFCFNLKARLQAISDVDMNFDPCQDLSGNIDELVAVLPEDEWVRGSVKPAAPTSSTLFYYASIERICQNLAREKLGSDYIPAGTFADFRAYLMSDILGVTPSDPLYEPIQSLLTNHFRETRDITTDKLKRFESVFVMACSSPLLTSLDF